MAEPKDIVAIIMDRLPAHYAALEGSPYLIEVLNYVHHRDIPNDAVESMLKGDLIQCASHGRENPRFWAQVPLLIQYLYNWAPRSCYGSEEKMDDWVDAVDHVDYAPRFVYDN